ncbi:CLUMA_CG007187, isoform A [Clunio marinus]|uniref:CLUMA_CG007187, isoform A n=1 Tax=Clunio marinus TaxID=568069 RepID=A0A1J1I1M6_9DIPT|nr:CLUMA_CG007187, isoform A [Clunio marinus]
MSDFNKKEKKKTLKSHKLRSEFNNLYVVKRMKKKMSRSQCFTGMVKHSKTLKKLAEKHSLNVKVLINCDV